MFQSYALVVWDVKTHDRNRIHDPTHNNKKIKLGINGLHDKFHRSDGALATIDAHDIWQYIHTTPGVDSMLCTSCKIMTILATSRGKQRTTQPIYPFEKIQVNTVLHSEPLRPSYESRYNYFIILCDRYPRTFRLAGTYT